MSNFTMRRQEGPTNAEGLWSMVVLIAFRRIHIGDIKGLVLQEHMLDLIINHNAINDTHVC